MASNPTKTQQQTAASTMASQMSSHGRGGAGNMVNASQSPKINPSDLETPVLKKSVVTTGRGGTGNMAKNDDPYETRLRQDVGAVPRRFSSGAQHAGRGGAGNVFREDEDTPELVRKASREQAIVDDSSDRTDGKPVSPGVETSKRRNWLFGKKG